MKKHLLALSLFLGITSLTACATSSDYFQSNYKSLSENTDLVSGYTPLNIIAKESQQALQAQQLLTKYRQMHSETLTTRQAKFYTDKMAFDYIGKPENLLSSIAINYGYRFIQVGNTKDLPTVNFTKAYGTPIDIVINVDAQLGGLANISINEQEKLINLVY